MMLYYKTEVISYYKYIFHFLIIAIAVSICYANTLNQEWHFDDYPNIVYDQNIHWDDLSVNNILKIYNDSYGYKRLSRPLPRITFGLNYYFTKLNTKSYHIVNILIHIITAWIIYLIFHKLLLLHKSGEKISSYNISYQDIALLGAILWAIHPLQTQAVTFIVQRMASMSAMFYVAALYVYMNIRLYNHYILKKHILDVVCIIFWGCSILSKENGVLFPLSVILFEITFFKINKNKIIFIAISMLLFIIISAITFIMTRESDNNNSLNIISYFSDKIFSPYAERTFTPRERLLTESRILVYYIFLVIYPVSNFLSMESDITLSTSLFNPITTLLSVLSIAFVSFLSVFYIKKYKLLAFSILFFFVNHLVESTIIGLELYFEHRNYLPTIFIYLSISFYMIKFYYYYANKCISFIKKLIIVFIIFVLVAEGNATYLRNDNWQSEESLCLDNISKAPNNIRPMISLASYYIRQNNFDLALQQLKHAEDIYKRKNVKFQDTWISMLYHNAGSVYYHKADYDKAIHYLLKSLEFYQYSWETHTLLGLLFFLTGDYENSVNAYTNAVAIKSDDQRILNMYGRALFAIEKYDLAIEVFNKGIEQTQDKNDMVELYLNIIACHMKLGNKLLAKRTFYKILPQDRDITYLLYKIILFEDESLENSYTKLVEILNNNNIEYCTWINDLRKNVFPGIIYPPVEAFQDNLLLFFKKNIMDRKKSLDSSLSAINNCGCSTESVGFPE